MHRAERKVVGDAGSRGAHGVSVFVLLGDWLLQMFPLTLGSVFINVLV